MPRNRPLPGWSDPSNSDRDSSDRDRDGWFADTNTHGSRASESSLPDVANFSPETNAFLWALDGESDSFNDGFAPRSPSSVGRVEFGQPERSGPIDNQPINGQSRQSTWPGDRFDQNGQDGEAPLGYVDLNELPEETFPVDSDATQEFSALSLPPVRPNKDPAQHHQPDQWFDRTNTPRVQAASAHDDFRQRSQRVDYRSGIDRDVVSTSPGIASRPERVGFVPGGYQDEVSKQPLRRSSNRQPVRRSRKRSNNRYNVEEKSKSHKVRDQIVEIVFLVVPAIILVLLVRSFVVSPFLIPTSSMEPTLEIGDRVLVNKLSYRIGDVGRGDIVVVELEDGGEAKTVIKRAIGLPGERIEIRNNQVIINDELALDESEYLEDDVVNEDFGPVLVPSDELFVLGDNREISDDSSKALGPVPTERVVGRAFGRYLPLDRFGSL